MSSRIWLDERFGGRYAVVYYLDGEPGTDVGSIGEDDSRDHVTRAIEAAARKFQHSQRWDEHGMEDPHETSSRHVALELLRFCRAAERAATSEKPWPQWAMDAIDAGWGPPKGWKP